MKSLPLLLLFAACGGVSSDPNTADATTSPDATADGPSNAQTVTEQEPNNERVEATQFPSGGGTFVVHGTCADSADLDYYDVHPAMLGTYNWQLTWQAGNYQLMFDPEAGMSGGQTKSTVPPIMSSGAITANPAQFGIDCYNTGDPPGLAGLAYTLTITLP